MEFPELVASLNIFQLKDLNARCVTRISEITGISSGIPCPMTPKFRYGDLVEFYSNRDHKMLQARVEKVNAKSLSVRTVDTKARWRVSPGFCKTVGDGKEILVPPTSVVHVDKITMGAAPSVGARSTAAGAGAW